MIKIGFICCSSLKEMPTDDVVYSDCEELPDSYCVLTDSYFLAKWSIEMALKNYYGRIRSYECNLRHGCSFIILFKYLQYIQLSIWVRVPPSENYKCSMSQVAEERG